MRGRCVWWKQKGEATVLSVIDVVSIDDDKPILGISVVWLSDRMERVSSVYAV